MIEKRLGDPHSAAQLLTELYVDLRRRVRDWSAVTRQTPQARMGYVGQHLASVVTGFPGGRSGARGHDLELPGGMWAEIKTCYRVDQLGSCGACGAAVSSIEDQCSECGGTEIIRKDDSKWLITVRNDAEMAAAFSPAFYYFVLFDFVAGAADEPVEEGSEAAEIVTVETPTIMSRIWRVDPRRPGFAMCIVDYYVNIRANSSSKAPFNLWPFSLKFQLMRPELIYQARILPDDRIETDLFEASIGDARVYPLAPLTAFSGSHTNLPTTSLIHLADAHGIQLDSGNRVDILVTLEAIRLAQEWSDEALAAELADLLYGQKIEGFDAWLPGTST